MCILLHTLHLLFRSFSCTPVVVLRNYCKLNELCLVLCASALLSLISLCSAASLTWHCLPCSHRCWSLILSSVLYQMCSREILHRLENHCLWNLNINGHTQTRTYTHTHTHTHNLRWIHNMGSPQYNLLYANSQWSCNNHKLCLSWWIQWCWWTCSQLVLFTWGIVGSHSGANMV